VAFDSSVELLEDGLALAPGLSVALCRGAVTARASFPIHALIGPGGLSAAPGDIALCAGWSTPFLDFRLGVGAELTFPPGRALPDVGGPGPGSAFWGVAGTLEAARILDPVAAAIEMKAGIRIARGRRPAIPCAGLDLSLAQAINAVLSLGLSAGIDADFPRERRRAALELSGGAGIAVMWRGRGLAYRAGLSSALGDLASGGPVLDLGVEYFRAGSRGRSDE